MKRFDEKDYISCQDRINRFWDEYPQGAINTEVVHGVNFDTVIVRAEVWKRLDDPRPAATGIAAEARGADYKSGANFTSWHENAETSAIGRALANMGYATSQHDRMTREEVGKVNRGQDATQTRSDAPGRTEPPRKASTSTNTAPDVPVASSVAVDMITQEQVDRIAVLKNQKGLTDAGIKALHGRASARDLTWDEAERLIEMFDDYPDVIEPVAQGELVTAARADRAERYAQ